jgi:outer membrane lipoprotein-sorting protein
MNLAPRFSRRARWAVPSGAIAAVGVVAVTSSALTSAQAAPALPHRTPAQLIAAIATGKPPAALSGTIVINAALGLPDLPGSGDPASITSLLTGSHTIKIWYASPDKLRLALPMQLGETDLRVDGRQIWLWDSRANTATQVRLPAAPAIRIGGHHGQLGRARQEWNTQSRGFAPAPTPQAAARALLAAIGPTTTVSVASNMIVAGRPAYQLTLAPKNSQSLIGRVSIAVDASRYLPLRVQVFARGASSPAYQVGYTSISFARPAASNFSFTPPPGAKVKTIRPPAGPPLGALSAGGAGLVFPPAMITCPGIRAPLNDKPTGRRISSANCARLVPGQQAGNGGRLVMPRRMLRCHHVRVFFNGTPKDREILPVKCAMVLNRAVPLPKGSLTLNPLRADMKNMRIATPQHLNMSQRKRLRSALRMQALRCGITGVRRLHPRAGLIASMPSAGLAFPAGALPVGPGGAPRVIGSGWTAVAVFPAAGLTAGSAGGPAAALLRSATPVHGSWGSGRLLRTSLLSVLITSDGRALIGAVTPSVLYAAAARAT